MLLFPLAKILKLSIATGLLQESAWALMLEWGGEVRRAPVLKLLPACSAMGIIKVYETGLLSYGCGKGPHVQFSVVKH